jgi:L-fucose isomerase-like protein
MKMTPPLTIAVLPVGEFDAELVKSQFESKVSALKHLGPHLMVADPISDQAEAQRLVPALAAGMPDLLVIIALRGLSAQAQEAAARLSRTPCLLWPIEGRYALPSSVLAAGALREANIPVELLYGPPDHPISLARLQCVTRTATAFSRIRRSRIGVVGGVFPNLVSCRYDPQVVSTRLGTTLLPISFQAVRDSTRLAAQRVAEVEGLGQVITEAYDVIATDKSALEAGLHLHLALKQIAQEQELDGFATECWTSLPKELGLNPCLGFIDDTYALACEGDVMLCVSLLLVRYLTGTSAYVGDLYDLNLDGQLTLIHCGAPASLASNKGEVALGKSQLALERGFETITCRPRLASGPVTLFRFYGRECDKLHVASAELLSCEQSPNLAVKLKINGSRWDFLDRCLGNHYLVVAGDIRQELALLARWLDIAVFET